MGAPCFYRVYIPESHAEALNVPSEFLEDIKEALPHNITLRDQYNNSWQLKLKKVGNLWYFKGGWKKFIEDNFVERGYALMFEYHGGVFQFKIFGINGYIMKGVGGPMPNNTNNTVQEQEDGDTAEVSNRISDWFDPEPFISGRADKPTNRYFVTRTTQKKDELYIPKNVIERYNLNLPEYTVFIDERGEEYPSKLHLWSDGRSRYIGGWEKLCKHNSVRKNDKIICEFIRGKDGELYIYVHFVRANRN